MKGTTNSAKNNGQISCKRVDYMDSKKQLKEIIRSPNSTDIHASNGYIWSMSRGPVDGHTYDHVPGKQPRPVIRLETFGLTYISHPVKCCTYISAPWAEGCSKQYNHHKMGEIISIDGARCCWFHGSLKCILLGISAIIRQLGGWLKKSPRRWKWNQWKRCCDTESGSQMFHQCFHRVLHRYPIVLLSQKKNYFEQRIKY